MDTIKWHKSWDMSRRGAGNVLIWDQDNMLKITKAIKSTKVTTCLNPNDANLKKKTAIPWMNEQTLEDNNLQQHLSVNTE